MNEIEYRLERTPPINEDPEDGVFEDVALEQQVCSTHLQLASIPQGLAFIKLMLYKQQVQFVMESKSGMIRQYSRIATHTLSQGRPLASWTDCFQSDPRQRGPALCILTYCNFNRSCVGNAGARPKVHFKREACFQRKSK